MTFAFDLISDLHIDTWPQFDWTGQATSPYCVVAGDVGRDPAAMEDALRHLACCYQAVFYIDGNDEHRHQLDDLNGSYQAVEQTLKSIPGVVYLHSDVVIINGVAILAANGWWSYDFDPQLELNQSVQWVMDKEKISEAAAMNINGLGYNDVGYMVNGVQKLQTHNDVKAIIMVTHTVPHPEIIQHDLELIDTWRFNSMGNSHMQNALREDLENKIKIWCFGHYHRPVDTIINGVRYISNPRGRGNTPYSQIAYYPKRISIKI